MFKKGLVTLVCLTVMSAVCAWAATTYSVRTQVTNTGGTMGTIKVGNKAPQSAGIQYANCSTAVAVVVTPNAGFKISALKQIVGATVTDITPADGAATTVNIAKPLPADPKRPAVLLAQGVTATFASTNAVAGTPKTWQLQLTNTNRGGQIATNGVKALTLTSVGLPKLVNYNDTTAVTATVTADTGYIIKNVMTSGSAAFNGDRTVCTVTGIPAANKSVNPVVVTYQKKSLSVTTTATNPADTVDRIAHGIAPLNPSVAYGGTVRLIITPTGANNVVKSLVVSGGSVALTDRFGAPVILPFQGPVKATISNIISDITVTATYAKDTTLAMQRNCTDTCHLATSVSQATKDVPANWLASGHKAKGVDCVTCHVTMPGPVVKATVSKTTFQALTTVRFGRYSSGVYLSSSRDVAKGGNFCASCHNPGHGLTGEMASCAGCHTPNNGGPHEITPIASITANAACLSASCHGNPALVKTITVPNKSSETVPLYVNAAVYATTIHGAQKCVSCHTDITLAKGGHANVPKMFGGWARFSEKQNVAFSPNTNNIAAGSEDTRNYVTAASRSCSTANCHPNMSAFASSPHATIYKQVEAHIDPALTAYATACEGKPYNIGENWGNGDCNRCHATCGTCHFKSTISRLGNQPITNVWDEVQATGKVNNVTVSGGLTEFKMDWTTNVASHDFRAKAYFANDTEKVCEACHTGFNNPAQNAYYWKGEERSYTNLTTVGIAKATYVRRHPQQTELEISGSKVISPLTGGSNTAHAAMTCNDCHGTASGKSGNIHTLPGEEYNWAIKGDINCTDCHGPGQVNEHLHVNPWVAAHVSGGFAEGTKVACIGCHSFGLARDFELAKNGTSSSNDVFIDPVTKEVRPVVYKNGHAIAWYSHNWQTLDPGAGKLDPAGDCAKKCHYQGNLVGAGFTQGTTLAGSHGTSANSCSTCHTDQLNAVVGQSRIVQNSAGHNVAAGSNECLLCHTDYADWADTPHTQKAQVGKEYVIGYNADPALYTEAAKWITDNRYTYIHPSNKNVDGTAKDPTKVGVRAVMTEKPTVTFSDQTFGVEDITIVIGSNHKQAYAVWMQGYGNKVLNIRYNGLDPGLVRSMGDRVDERTWEGSCIGCHVTGYDTDAVPAGYKDSATPYDLSSSMNDLRIGCVACHGSAVDQDGHALNPADLTQDQQIDICGRCHGNWNSTVAGTTARKDVPWFNPGESLEFVLSPAYTRNNGVDRVRKPSWNPADTATKPFLGNGASNDDHQQWYDIKIGNHYGTSVTCTTCHDPHKKSTQAGRVYGRIILKGNYIPADGKSDICKTCHEGNAAIVGADGYTVVKKGKTGAINPHTAKPYGKGVDLDPNLEGEQLPATGSPWPWQD